MSIFAALRAYMGLSKQQKRLLKTKRLEGEDTQQAWLSLFGGLARYDTHGDRLRRLSGIGFFVLLVPAFFSMAYPPLMLISFPLLAASGIIWLLTRRADLSNHLRLFVLPLITLLGDDMKPGSTLHLKLDLRGGLVKDKRTEKKAPYKKGVYHKIVETLYLDPWLSGDMVLADGSRLQIHLSDAIRELKKTKRTARGKTKSKKKYKVKGLMDVHLKLPVERYQAKALAASTNREMRIDVRQGEKWIGVRARRVVPRDGDALQSMPLEPLLEVLTKLYGAAELKSLEGPENA